MLRKKTTIKSLASVTALDQTIMFCPLIQRLSFFFRYYDPSRQTNDENLHHANLNNNDEKLNDNFETSSLLSILRPKIRDESSDDESKLRRQYVATNLQRLKRIVRDHVRSAARANVVRI